MKAIVQIKYGGPEVLGIQDVEKPSPNGNEVLIKIHAAGVTAADSMMRAGKPKYGRLFLGLRGPKHKTPGTGFSGVVEAVGPEVTRFAEGDELFGEIVFGSGTYAEYVAVPEDGVIAKKPTHYSFDEAAAVSDGPLTSINFLKDVTSVVPGQRVLINGASGSLGSAAVQLAKHFGAHVTGVCSTANIELVKSLGADEVIDYTQQDFTRSSEQWDVIYDTVGKSSFGRAQTGSHFRGCLSLAGPVAALAAAHDGDVDWGTEESEVRRHRYEGHTRTPGTPLRGGPNHQ
jgi:NADPH:quinone reductase-like Zn-dependent oxidoreductase